MFYSVLFLLFLMRNHLKNLMPCKNVEMKAIKEDCDKLLYILQQKCQKNCLLDFFAEWEKF